VNKKRVDSLIPEAYKKLEITGIVEGGKIKNTWRGQISSFGAAVATGSLLAAVSFFNAQGNSDVPRQKLMEAIFSLIGSVSGCSSLFEYVVKCKKDGRERSAKEEIINGAIALKLAMNLYERV
jgi:CRISPR-associated protein Cmr5